MDPIEQPAPLRNLRDDAGHDFECPEEIVKSKDRKKEAFLKAHCVDISDVPHREREEDRLA